MDLSQLVVPDAVKHPTPIVTCTIEGILDEEDLRRLCGVGGEPGPNPPSLQVTPQDPTDLKKLREKHHSAARALASGMSQRMVAAIAGYTETYISILLNQPAMKELVEMYRIQQGAASAVISEKLRTVGLKALEKIDDKLEADTQNQISITELKEVAKLGLDRGGHGPQSKHHVINENHDIDHARIAELNQRARERSAGYIVPVKEVRQAVLPAPKADGDEAA